MSINQKPLRSELGFESPGFNVDIAGNVNITGAFKVNGVSIHGSGGTLPSNYVYSNLTRLGTLSQLTVHGTTSITSGTITINSSGVLTLNSTAAGTLDNVAIGNTTPLSGIFTSLESDMLTTGNISATEITTTILSVPSITTTSINTTSLSVNTLSVSTSVSINPTTLGTLNNVNIGSITPGTGKFTALTVTTNPTSSTDATPKKYVDTRVTAMAIALGS